MDFNFDKMNHQTPSQGDDQSIDFNNLEQSDFPYSLSRYSRRTQC